MPLVFDLGPLGNVVGCRICAVNSGISIRNAPYLLATAAGITGCAGTAHVPDLGIPSHFGIGFRTCGCIGPLDSLISQRSHSAHEVEPDIPLVQLVSIAVLFA
jgi:hypothetical protein